MRVFHMQRNWKHCPTINTDKLWSLVSEEARKEAAKSKDKVPVIDVTKSVSTFVFPLFSAINSLLNNKGINFKRLNFNILFHMDTSRSSVKEFSQRFHSSLRPNFSPRLPRRELRKPVVLASSPLENITYQLI